MTDITVDDNQTSAFQYPSYSNGSDTLNVTFSGKSGIFDLSVAALLDGANNNITVNLTSSLANTFSLNYGDHTISGETEYSSTTNTTTSIVTSGTNTITINYQGNPFP